MQHHLFPFVDNHVLTRHAKKSINIYEKNTSVIGKSLIYVKQERERAIYLCKSKQEDQVTVIGLKT